MILGENSVVSKFGGGGVERLKSQKMFLFKPLEELRALKNFPIDNLKLYNLSKNQPLRMSRRGDMTFSLFNLQKGIFPPYFLSELS